MDPVHDRAPPRKRGLAVHDRRGSAPIVSPADGSRMIHPDAFRDDKTYFRFGTAAVVVRHTR